MKKIFFWAPHNSKVGTVNSVINSVKSIKKFSKNSFKPYLIDTTGEWNNYEEKFNIINLRKNKFDLRRIRNKGFFWSRIFFLLVFFLNLKKLKKLLDKEKPEYLIIHLITSLPLFLYLIFNFKTKLILRISGEPRLGLLRKFFWKLLSKKIFAITCPNNKIKDLLVKKKIFQESKLKILLDPVIDIKELIIQKKNNYNKDFKNKKYFLSVGRLTKQKNFGFLIKAIDNLKKDYPNIKLLILGEGEEKKSLADLITKLKLEKNVFLKGFKKNVYSYMQNARCLILTSLSENPGHVLIEAAINNCPIISSDCPTGPSEFLEKGKCGFLFETNNEKDLIINLKKFIAQNKSENYKKKYFAKKNSINYTGFRHYLKLSDIIN